MKKLISIFLISIMVIALVPAVVFAGTNPTISVECKDANPGELVYFDIVLSGNSGFNDLSIEISFDSAYTYSSITNVRQVGTRAGSRIDNNTITLSWVSNSLIKDNGVFATIGLEISDNASGFCPIYISYFKGKNKDFVDGYNVNYSGNKNPINLQYKNGGTYIGNEIDWDSMYMYYAQYDENHKMISLKPIDYSFFFNVPTTGKYFCLSKQTCKPVELEMAPLM